MMPAPANPARRPPARGLPVPRAARIWLFAALSLAGPLFAQQEQQPNQTQKTIAANLFQQFVQAFEKGDYPKAEELLRRQLQIQPDNFVAFYNLACCRAKQEDPAGAGEFLVEAVEHGFTDIRHLRNDPTFANVRDDANYRRIVENWPTLQLASLEANLKVQRRLFSKGYHEWRDERLKLACLSAFDQRSDETVRAEFNRLADWAVANVMPDLLDPALMEDDAWVVVVLPSQTDFMKWTASVYGADALRSTSMIAGSYEHDNKRLVSMDLGSTLRHEFFHVLHWRSITRLGRDQPWWVMEGLCGLVEDYDLLDNGDIVPVPSWRTNTLKRIERIGKLTPVKDLTGFSQLKFLGSRVLANYAASRAVFLYLYQQGKLKDWYAHYSANHFADPTGLKSIEAVTAMTSKDFDAEFKQWVRQLPSVPEEIKPGMASLGIEIENGAGDGPVVTGVNRRPDGYKPDLKPQDIITAIDNKPVREMAELVRVLGGYQPGDTVEVSYRRYRLYGTTSVQLVKK
ncbi:hypothetical protein PHYC_03197 [Phycisphaerales bacterium]|nr:hypothetical protein PHYC_03197 [Phycisphaerales bacterium]